MHYVLCLILLLLLPVANAADEQWLNRMAAKGLVVEGMTKAHVIKARGVAGKHVNGAWQYATGQCDTVYDVEKNTAGFEVSTAKQRPCFIERIVFNQGRVTSVTNHSRR